MTNSNKSHAAQDAMTDNQSSGSATSRKRSSGINLSRMRKSYALKPLAIGIASVFLSACGEEKQDAQIYTSLEDCKRDFPDAVERCDAAYKTATEEAMRTSPRFNSEYDCEYEFGANYSSYRSRWVTADGNVFSGDIRKRNYKVGLDTLKPKPTVNRTMKRGGFGSSVRAKSSWGSSSRKGSWGG